MLCALPVHFVRSDAILPNECHYPEHAASLAETLRREQLWRIPIVLECNSLAVMDGHHRLQAALQLKLAYVPCLLLGYGDVEVIATREGYLVTPQEIVRSAKIIDLYPSRKPRAIDFHRHCRPAMFRYGCCAEGPIAASVIAG